MLSLERLYELGEAISKVETTTKKFDEVADLFTEVLTGAHSTDPKVKRLTSQFIGRFFGHFPLCNSQAMDAMLDLCEDSDVEIRKQAVKDLPMLCRDVKSYQPKIVDVLAQLLQSTDEGEILVIHASMVKLFHKDPKATLIGLFSQIKSGGDIVRERALKFLHAKMTSGSGLLSKEAEFTLLQEIKASLDDCSADEFQLFMSLLGSTSIPKSITGQTQMLEIALTVAGVNDDGNFDGSDSEMVEKLVQCGEVAATYFSSRVKSTRVFEFICLDILPQLESIADADLQTRLLKILGEAAVFTSQMKEPKRAAQNVYIKLMTLMPPPPADAVVVDPSMEPEFEFTKVECLLLAYHTIGKQGADNVANDEEAAKDFRSRLQYFSRGNAAYLKKLKEHLSNKSNIELKKEENKLRSVALRCTTNIQTLIRDLFHIPPIFKATVLVSWRSKEQKTSNTQTVKAGMKRQPITFSSDGKRPRPDQTSNGNRKQFSSGGGGNSLYTPPTGKYSSAVDGYKENTSGGRGRGRGQGRWQRGGRYSY